MHTKINNWKSEEINLLYILYKYYGLSSKQLIVFINRSQTAIKLKIKRLHLHHTKKQKFILYRLANLKEKNSQWQGGMIDFKCKICNKIVKRKRGFIKYKIHYCSKNCQLLDRNLENNPNWQGGKSFEPYPLGWNNTYKEQIRYRDSYRCQICGVPEVECDRKLEVHHKDYNKNNISPDNLISLCTKCHRKTNGNREYWKGYFSNDINRKNTEFIQQS